MSLYQFFASDKIMPEYDDHKVIPITEQGETKAIRVFDEVNAMRIIAEDDLSCAGYFTDQKYVNYMEWRYQEKNAAILLDYISMLLKDRYKVYLFNVWENDRSPVKKTKKDIDELSVSDICNIWGKEFFEGNECLEVYKRWKRS